MIRNRNGYWMSPQFFMNADDGGSAGNSGAAGDNAQSGNESGQNAVNQTGNADADKNGGDESANAMKAELERLKGELAKQKSALDAATKEAGDYRKQLRAKQTAEEIAAEEKKAADEKAAKEIDELRREVAKTRTVRNVMSKLGTDEETSAKIAEYLYGAEDPENAMSVIKQAWDAREKALRMEFGKVPPPGSGGSSPEEIAAQENIKRAQELGKQKAEQNDTARKAINAYMR